MVENSPADSIFKEFAHFRLLFQESAIGLNLCRLSDGLWIDSNPAFLSIIGYPKEEADGILTYWELTPREYDSQETEQLERLLSTGRYGPYEKEFIRKDGSRVHVRLNGFVVKYDNQDFIWSFIEDNTEKKLLEKKYQEEHLKALQSAKLATLGEMAAGFAHEINNPLAIIGGYADIMPNIVESGDAEEFRNAIAKIRNAVDRASRIVQGVRTFARAEERGTLGPVSLQKVIDDTLVLCQPRMQSRKVNIEVPHSLDHRVMARRLELSQVLLNLINNAFHAVGSDTEAPVVKISCQPVGERIEICVSDSGPGIPEEIETRVFDPFFTTKAIGEGTGLGLSISRGIMEDFGGSLHLERREGMTCFVATLNRANTR